MNSTGLIKALILPFSLLCWALIGFGIFSAYHHVRARYASREIVREVYLKFGQTGYLELVKPDGQYANLKVAGPMVLITKLHASPRTFKPLPPTSSIAFFVPPCPTMYTWTGQFIFQRTPFPSSALLRGKGPTL